MEEKYNWSSTDGGAEEDGMNDDKFWEKPLESLSADQWEKLCDRCGRCCLKRVVDESNVHYTTRVVCKYYDEDKSRCSEYAKRSYLVPDCLDVKTMDIARAKWMPSTCAYRLRAEGRPLFDWHPLIFGSGDEMERLKIGIRGRVINEDFVHPDGYEEHIVTWVD